MSNDFWLHNHTVVWDRRVQGTQSGIDDAPLISDTNFPKTITGDLQQLSGDRSIRSRGVEISIRATFFTNKSGISANDLITFNNQNYIVLSVIPNYAPNNTIDHYECVLSYET